MAEIKIFWCESTGEAVVTERYRCTSCGERTVISKGRFPETARPDAAWDTTRPCGACGKDAALSSQGFSTIYRRVDTGAELNPDGGPLPAGAVYAQNPEYAYADGPDGRSLMCVLPDGHVWGIDGRANNCTLPDDKEHRCWVRHGRPEDGTLHVDKAGLTCAAGAGSIATSKYHGFLHHGVLRDC